MNEYNILPLIQEPMVPDEIQYNQNSYENNKPWWKEEVKTMMTNLLGMDEEFNEYKQFQGAKIWWIQKL